MGDQNHYTAIIKNGTFAKRIIELMLIKLSAMCKMKDLTLLDSAVELAIEVAAIILNPTPLPDSPNNTLGNGQLDLGKSTKINTETQQKAARADEKVLRVKPGIKSK